MLRLTTNGNYLMEGKKIVINRTGTQDMRKNMFCLGKDIVHIGLVAFKNTLNAEAHETDANKKNVKRNE